MVTHYPCPDGCGFWRAEVPGVRVKYVGYLPRKMTWWTPVDAVATTSKKQNYTSRTVGYRGTSEEDCFAYVKQFLDDAARNGAV